MFVTAVQPRYEQRWGTATQCFQHSPIVDLRTPASTFECFCRATLTRQPLVLWQTIHPRLQQAMQQRLQREGHDQFFTRMSKILISSHGRLRLGTPTSQQTGDLSCPVYRGGVQVAVAHFHLWDHQWVLASFVDL